MQPSALRTRYLARAQGVIFAPGCAKALNFPRRVPPGQPRISAVRADSSGAGGRQRSVVKSHATWFEPVYPDQAKTDTR